ncbi:MAG: hypothetical protein LBQ88_04650 [Treponema sp.]|jgi:hypothetical protein|nr:hypothetical protein [Treponema sp.]
MDAAVKYAIIEGSTSLGIELGSTRVKAVLIDKNHVVRKVQYTQVARRVFSAACSGALPVPPPIQRQALLFYSCQRGLIPKSPLT